MGKQTVIWQNNLKKDRQLLAEPGVIQARSHSKWLSRGLSGERHAIGQDMRVHQRLIPESSIGPLTNDSCLG